MTDTAEDSMFGCAHCAPADAEAAAQAARTLDLAHRLIDDSHYIVSLLQCRHCGQGYLSVFTEIIDWIGGEDPQYRTLLPITQEEARMLASRGAEITEHELNRLGPQRRSLCVDFPRDGNKRAFWHRGLFVGPHD
jgi:hypothetical protein